MSLTRLRLPGGLVNNVTQNLVGAGELFTTGNVFYVDSASGSDGNLGDDPNFPKATLDSAVSAAVANNGDIIVLMPNHAQNIAGATEFQIDKAGLSIIGVGNGRNRPTFTFTNTAGSVEIDSADTRLSNITFLASVSAVLVGINVDANDVVLDNLEFNWDESGDDFVRCIDIDAANRVRVTNCRFNAEEAVGAQCGIRLSDVDEVVIDSNEFSGAFNSAGVYASGATGSGNAIVYNTIYNSHATGGCIDLNVALTGVIGYNLLGAAVAAASSVLDPGSMRCIENYASTAIDVGGVILPQAGSGQ